VVAQPALFSPIAYHDALQGLLQGAIQNRPHFRILKRFVPELPAAAVTQVGQDRMCRVVQIQFARDIHGKVVRRLQAGDGRQWAAERRTIHRQDRVGLGNDQRRVRGSERGGQLRDHAADHRVDKADVGVGVVALFTGEMRRDQVVKRGGGVRQVLTDDDVQGRRSIP